LNITIRGLKNTSKNWSAYKGSQETWGVVALFSKEHNIGM